MNLYHGSLEIVEKPIIMQSVRTLDYGTGFYTTTSYEQAEQWTRRRMEGNASIGYVNCYQLNTDVLPLMHVLWFDEPTTEWVDFVMANRTQEDFAHSYDLVYGPVANDRVYAAFALYEGGLIEKEGLIRELKTYRLIVQMLFHTDVALEHLVYIESKNITL
ncbi:MAG: DUF3990 domain-containing protein [Mediterranea sp.]|jgi:hypothetical protein|nr:DUF3990 domain-containing protein [Mediterranea sp.]